MSNRYRNAGPLPGLDHYLTPDDEDERTEEQITEDKEAEDDAAIAAAEIDDLYDYDGP